MKRFASVLCFLMVAVFAIGQEEENLKVRFDFTNIKNSIIRDVVTGAPGRMFNSAKVDSLGKWKYLDLGSEDGYFEMYTNTGKIIAALEDFTVSICYKVEDGTDIGAAGNHLWIFSKLKENSATAGPYIHYRINAQRLASTANGWDNEAGMEVGSASKKGKWMHMLYRQRGTNGELFIDGKRVASNGSMPILNDIFTTTPEALWLGKPAFPGDVYLKNTKITDFRIYNAAVSDETVAALADVATQLEYEQNYGTTGDFTSLKATIESCQAFIGSASGYAPNAIAELEDALTTARLAVESGRGSQTLIDKYEDNLKSALAHLKTTAGFTPKTKFDYKPGNKGFVHPGALVTQADIDRAKKLIFEDKDDYMVRAWDILCANQYSQSNVATWPTEYVQRGLSGDNYMNAARGAAMAFQNALRWKISGDRAHADKAVGILMQWCDVTKAVTGNTNISLASGLYGYGFANAAELMRDYDGWAPEDFERFKKWMIKVWYNPAIDFLRRRHDTWSNFRHPDRGERPGHYWSNWGLCNVLCVMSIGILCDDVHMYNQGVSFYKYDHQGTFVEDRTTTPMIYNDGCNEFIGNLVPITMPDERGPFGFLGQMQESGRDQGHTVMALCCALDVCQIGFNQGDDLYAYMDDRIAAGCEYVCALNYAGISGSNLPWYPYEYADCAGPRGASWQMFGPNEGGKGERRPNWDRIRGYYEGLRGVKLQYADKAAELLCPDGGGGNYNANSGGYDHLGFSSLTNYRPLIDKADAITPLSGDIIYNGVTYKEQTNLGGLKYRHERGKSFAIPADGADITLIPQLPEGTEDTGNWLWETGETTRQITVKADKSYIYRVTYTAANGKQSQQSFAIAVAGDADADPMTNEITVDGVIERITEKSVLSGKSVILYSEAVTGWTDDYLWDNGVKGTIVVIPNITTSRTYTCQFASQSGAVSESKFHLNVVPALQSITVDGGVLNSNTAEVFPGSDVTFTLTIPEMMNPEEIVWQDGTKGTELYVENIKEAGAYTATYQGETYTYTITLKEASHSYFTEILTEENGYTHIVTEEQLANALSDSYFVICSDEADLMMGLGDGVENGNKALFYQPSVNPLTDMSKVFTLEAFDGGYCLRNIDYDGLLLQTEMNAAWNIRTHDQPYPISWARFLFSTTGSTWTVENGTYPGNWLGLWYPENGFVDGEEMACNKTGTDIGQFQIFAIKKSRFHSDLLAGATLDNPIDATPLVQNPAFIGNSWTLWNVTGTFGNQRFNGAAETWHSTNFSMQQTLKVPSGYYTVTTQMANGEGVNTGYLYATSGETTVTDVVEQSCANSNFDAERDKMNNPTYGLLSVEIYVAEGEDLTFGIKEPTNDTTWLVFDNFTLTCTGSVSTGIEGINADSKTGDDSIYDLTGRKMQTTALPKGVYIQNGRKFIIK